jgi:hypothetical protein
MIPPVLPSIEELQPVLENAVPEFAKDNILTARTDNPRLSGGRHSELTLLRATEPSHEVAVSYERLAVWREDGKSMEGSSKISALARASSMQLSAVYFMALEAIPKPEQGFDGSVLRLAALVHLEVVDPRVDLAVVDVIAEVVHRAALLGVLGLVAAADVGGDGPLTGL